WQSAKCLLTGHGRSQTGEFGARSQISGRSPTIKPKLFPAGESFGSEGPQQQIVSVVKIRPVELQGKISTGQPFSAKQLCAFVLMEAYVIGLLLVIHLANCSIKYPLA